MTKQAEDPRSRAKVGAAAPLTRIDAVLTRIAQLVPAAYAVRIDRLIAAKSVALAILELPNEKPVRIQLSDAPAARGPVLHLLRSRLQLDRDTSDALLNELRTLAGLYPFSAWPLRPGARAARSLKVVGGQVQGADTLPGVAADQIRLALNYLPPEIVRLEIHELHINASDQRAVKRHYVRFLDASGQPRAALAWTLAITHVLYLTNPGEGEEPEANTLRLNTWAEQLRLPVPALVDLLVAFNTPVTLFGATHIQRAA